MQNTKTRKTRAELIRHEVTKYLTGRGMSCHYEVGLNSRGKLRADILALNYKRHMTVVEVKSSMADFVSDKKYLGYLPLSTSMYFAFDSDFKITDAIKNEIKSHGIGILIVDCNCQKLHLYRSKSVKVLIGAKTRAMCGEAKRDIIVRLAYRNGKLRTNKNTWK